MFLWVFVFFLITYNVWALFVCLPCGDIADIFLGRSNMKSTRVDSSNFLMPDFLQVACEAWGYNGQVLNLFLLMQYLQECHICC